MIRALFIAILSLLASDAFAREADLDPRFNGNGMWARKFDSDASKFDAATRVLVDKQGRYAVVGYADIGWVTLARLSPNGAYLGTESIHYTGLIDVTDAAIDSQGRIIVVGNRSVLVGATYDTDPVVCRFDANGYADTLLGPFGCRTYVIDHIANGSDDARAVAVDATDNVYVVGTTQVSAEDDDFLVMKLNAYDATPVSGFGNNGTKTTAFDIDTSHAGGDVDAANAILLQPPYLYVGGKAAENSGYDFALAKLSMLDGSYDPNFCPDANPCSGSKIVQTGHRTIAYNFGGTNADVIHTLAAADEGSIIVAGSAAAGGGSSKYVVTKLKSDGHYPLAAFGNNVTHYASDSIAGDTELADVVVREDGSIILAGTFGALSTSDTRLWVRQLDAGGMLVSDFATAAGQPWDTATFTFPNWNDSLPIDHISGKLTLDHGRIVLAGGRLWQRDTSSGLEDFDFAVVRMQGDSIFIDSLDF